MRKFCVACGKEDDEQRFGKVKRCESCQRFFVDGGGNRRIETIVERGGMRVANIDFKSDAPALFCHQCGDALDPGRMRYALLNGGECYTCAPCKRPGLYGKRN